ncbi:MAG: 16S rRNA (uracil(1498)-N(3))-methyltransferase [Candidatus Margulisiibacteriota bacterium]
MPRFFIPKEQIPTITGSDVHHIRDVLRMKTGDFLELLDGTGKVYRVRILKIEQERIICEIISQQQIETEPKVKVTIAQALPKGRKMDLVVEKCTELGVYQIIPMLTERTIAKTAKLDRWRKIAKSAAEQSGRGTIPEVSPLTSFEDILKMRKQFDLALIPWELEKEKTLKQVLKNFLIPQSSNLQIPISRSSNILILVGPEGGFAQKEIDLAKEAGFISISLGKRILRTETAGLMILSALIYEFD